MFAHCLPVILGVGTAMWGDTYKRAKTDSTMDVYPREEYATSPYLENAMDEVAPENDFPIKSVYQPPLTVVPTVSVLYLEQTLQQQTWTFMPIRYIRWMEIRLVANVGITPDPNSVYCYAFSNSLSNRQSYPQNMMVTSQFPGTQRSNVAWLQPCPGGIIPGLSDQLPAIRWEFRELVEFQNLNLTLASDTGGFFVFSGEVQKMLWEVRLGTETQ